MKARHFLSIASVDADDLGKLLVMAIDLKARHARGICETALAGRSLALLFEKPSLRTRASFETAMYQLGGHALSFDQAEVGLGRRESIRDAAAVLGGMVHGLVYRTFAQASVVEMAAHAGVPVINGLTDTDHPCQALTDVLTLHEHFGSVAGLRVAYVGDANNVARSLGQAVTRLGGRFVCAAPPAYQFTHEQATEIAPAGVELTDDPRRAVTGADVVYTDAWVSMGQESAAREKSAAFADYQVNEALLALARPHAVVMHCLPAHRGCEITDAVLDGPRSLVIRQAHNRLHAQKALLRVLLGS